MAIVVKPGRQCGCQSGPHSDVRSDVTLSGQHRTKEAGNRAINRAIHRSTNVWVAKLHRNTDARSGRACGRVKARNRFLRSAEM